MCVGTFGEESVGVGCNLFKHFHIFQALFPGINPPTCILPHREHLAAECTV